MIHIGLELMVLLLQSPAISAFVFKASVLPLAQLPGHLKSFPQRWPLPRGDLYHWIPLLNRFDDILENFNREYDLEAGPQSRPFGRGLLAKGVAEESKSSTVTSTSETDLDSLGLESDGDRVLVETLLEFSKSLLENCGNRSLYNSSERLGALLNTTSLSLLSSTLQLAIRLAQRYHASRQRGAGNQHLNNALLASHYNIDLEKVQKLANTFVKTPLPRHELAQTPTTAKGKGKAQASLRTLGSTGGNDLLALVQNPPLTNGSVKSHAPSNQHLVDAEDWGSVLLNYYQPATAKNEDSAPMTPTPSRRASGLSRPSQLSSTEDTEESSPAAHLGKSTEATTAGMKHLEIPHSKVASTPVEDILKEQSDAIPNDSRYDFLSKLRVAHAMTTSLATRQEMVKIRLLAITNLTYIYPEFTLQQKIFTPDSDEPRNLQLAYQLAELVHSSNNQRSGVPVPLQTVALGTLEALSKHKPKASDICAALTININHGILFSLLQRAVDDMGKEDTDELDVEKEEWREAVFSLLDALPASSPRTGETLMAAGLLEILIEVLNLRTKRAERNHPKVLTFLNTFIYTVRDAFQNLANAKGLDTISDLIAYEVQSSAERATEDGGLSMEYRNQVTDYQIPFYQQQTLRMLFKIINHMMSHSTGNFDRLLRNLIDSPQLLAGLRTVITNPKIFGSSVWSGAVNIMSSFIHNEPTSYAVISEAGLSKGLLDSMRSPALPVGEVNDSADGPEDRAQEGGQEQGLPDANADTETLMKYFLLELPKTQATRPEDYVLANGILPATDAIVTVPQAFGAICLNNSGMSLFRKSSALEHFFEIFESSDHVKALSSEMDLARLLGSSFDELVRHHPDLKMLVLSAILRMINRVIDLCKARGDKPGYGAKLWVETEKGDLLEADFRASSSTSQAITSPEDVENAMDEKNGPNSPTFIEICMKFLSGFFENHPHCSLFVEAGGATKIRELATLPGLPYDFNNTTASHEIAGILHRCAEQNPHLVLPGLLQQTQITADTLKPLLDYSKDGGYFEKYTTPRDPNIGPVECETGSSIVSSLVQIQTLCNIWIEVFSPPHFNSRSSHTPFSQVNLVDYYKSVIKCLGLLHRVCVWEEILLQKRIPESWTKATQIKGYGMGSAEADEIFGFLSNQDEEPEGLNGDSTMIDSEEQSSSNGTINGLSEKRSKRLSISTDKRTAAFKNTRTLRYLLSQIPSCIVPFLQGLGKALVGKRRAGPSDLYPRQSAHMVAESMSDAILDQLQYEAPKNYTSVKDRYAYWIVILTSISQLVIEGWLLSPHLHIVKAYQDFRPC